MEITEYLLKFSTYQAYKTWVNDSNNTIEQKCVCLIAENGGYIMYAGELQPE